MAEPTAAKAVTVVPREITDAEVATFRENGWAKIDSFISREGAAAMLAAVQAVMGAEPQAESQFASIERGANTGVKAGGMLDAGYWQDYHYIARDDQVEPCYSMVFSKEIGKAAQRFMNRDVPVRYSADLVACKMPEGKAGSDPTGWHQDISSLPFDRVGSLAFWVALDEVTEEMGAMNFLSGSQREGNMGRTRAQGMGTVEYYPELLERYSITEPLHLLPGDATVHNAAVIHGAPTNRSDRPRWAYILAYFPGDALWTGAYNQNFDGIGLEVNKPFDHPRFPVVYP